MSSSAAYHSCYVLFIKALSENQDALEKVQRLYCLPEPYGCLPAEATVHALERLGAFSSSNPLELMVLTKKLELQETYKKINKIIKNNYKIPPKIVSFNLSDLYHSADLQNLVKQLHKNTQVLYAQTELARMIVQARNTGGTRSAKINQLLKSFNEVHDKFQELNWSMDRILQECTLEMSEAPPPGLQKSKSSIAFSAVSQPTQPLENTRRSSQALPPPSQTLPPPSPPPQLTMTPPPLPSHHHRLTKSNSMTLSPPTPPPRPVPRPEWTLMESALRSQSDSQLDADDDDGIYVEPNSESKAGTLQAGPQPISYSSHESLDTVDYLPVLGTQAKVDKVPPLPSPRMDTSRRPLSGSSSRSSLRFIKEKFPLKSHGGSLRSSGQHEPTTDTCTVEHSPTRRVSAPPMVIVSPTLPSTSLPTTTEEIDREVEISRPRSDSQTGGIYESVQQLQEHKEQECLSSLTIPLPPPLSLSHSGSGSGDYKCDVSHQSTT